MLEEESFSTGKYQLEKKLPEGCVWYVSKFQGKHIFKMTFGNFLSE